MKTKTREEGDAKGKMTREKFKDEKQRPEKRRHGRKRRNNDQENKMNSRKPTYQLTRVDKMSFFLVRCGMILMHWLR